MNNCGALGVGAVCRDLRKECSRKASSNFQGQAWVQGTRGRSWRGLAEAAGRGSVVGGVHRQGPRWAFLSPGHGPAAQEEAAGARVQGCANHCPQGRWDQGSQTHFLCSESGCDLLGGEIPGSLVDLQRSRGGHVVECATNINKASGPVGGAAMSSRLSPEEQFLSSAHFLHTCMSKVAGAEHPGIPQATEPESDAGQPGIQGLSQDHAPQPARPEQLSALRRLLGPSRVPLAGLVPSTAFSSCGFGCSAVCSPRWATPAEIPATKCDCVARGETSALGAPSHVHSSSRRHRLTCLSHLQSSPVMSGCPPPSRVWPHMCLPSRLLWLSLPCACTQEGLLVFALHDGLSWELLESHLGGDASGLGSPQPASVSTWGLFAHHMRQPSVGGKPSPP
ncbi:hypothetical protein AAY473_034674 [Plecturocebus cupreus]